MNVLELSRWQFGITTVYHFLLAIAVLRAGYFVLEGAAPQTPAPQTAAPQTPAPKTAAR